MDVFELRNQVTDDDARYMPSFIKLRAATVAQVVDTRPPELWPDPLSQLNPEFEPSELIDDGLLHPACRDIFTSEAEGTNSSSSSPP